MNVMARVLHRIDGGTQWSHYVHERRFDSSGIQSGVTRFEFESTDVPGQLGMQPESRRPLAWFRPSDFDMSPE